MDVPFKSGWIRHRAVRSAVIGVLVLVAGLAGVHFLYDYLDRQVEEAANARHQATEAAAHAAARQLAGRLATAAATLEHLAHRDEVRQHFEDAESGTLVAAGKYHLQAFEHGLMLRLLPPGRQRLETAANPPLGFASLDLLNRAQDSTAPLPAELHMPGSEQAHVVLVERVRDNGDNLIGLLHLSLRPGIIEQALHEPDVQGYYEIRQTVGGDRPTMIASGGRDNLKGLVPASTVSVDNTPWSLQFWSAHGVVDGGARPQAALAGPLLWPVATLVILLVAACAYWWRRRIAGANGAAGSDEQVIFGGAVKAMMEGAYPGPVQLVPYLPVTGAAAARPMASPPAVAAPADDVTHVAVPTVQPPQSSTPDSNNGTKD